MHKSLSRGHVRYRASIAEPVTTVLLPSGDLFTEHSHKGGVSWASPII